MCVGLSVCICMHSGADGGRKRMADPLGLELETVVSHLMLVLGTELWSFARAASAVNDRATAPALVFGFSRIQNPMWK